MSCMADILLSYTVPHLEAYFEVDNKNFREYLMLGFGFRRKDEHTLIKKYEDYTLLGNNLHEMNEEAKKNNITLELDPYLTSLIKTVECDVSSLEQSRHNGLNTQRNQYSKIDLPDNFYRKPKSFQLRSIAHVLSVQNSANFSVPGSGKTTISLAAYSILKEKKVIEKLLVVGPLSSFLAWEEEFEQCFQRRPKSARITGEKNQRHVQYQNSDDYEMFLVTYHMLKFEQKNIEALLQKHNFMMILDESHHIKNFYGGIHSSIALGLGKHARKKLILSGTPVPNSLEDLWSQFTFLWPREDLLGTKLAYKESINRDWKATKKRIEPFFVRITKDELKIPKPKIERVHVKLAPEHYDFYYELSRTFITKSKQYCGARENEFYRVCMAWLLQAIDDPNRLMMKQNTFMRLNKNKELMKMLFKYRKNARPQKIMNSYETVRKLISANKKVLYWTYFVNNIEGLAANEFKKFRPLVVYGEIPKDDSVDEDNREKRIRLFKADPKRKLLIANPAACAESISLHSVCSDAIYLDRTLNCAQYLQSLDRIHRIGITTNPHIRLYIASKTFDVRVDERLKEKEQLMLKILDDPFEPINLETSENDYYGAINLRMEREAAVDNELIKEELIGAKK